MDNARRIWFWRENGTQGCVIVMPKTPITMGNEQKSSTVARTDSKIQPVLLVNAKGEVYEHLEGNLFQNLSTGKEGELTRAKAQKNLKMPVKLNYMVDKNPALLDLLREFGTTVVMGQEP